MSVDLLGLFLYAKKAINEIWRLTLRRMLTQLLELNSLYETLHLSKIINRPYKSVHYF